MPDENNEREDNKKEKEDENNKCEDYEPKGNTTKTNTKRDTERV